MVLTQRLLKIAQMVEFKTLADIGTDHAKLPVYLIERKICDNVIASDVAEGPVNACKTTVLQHGMEDAIQIRKGNGLATINPGEVETVVIAGMGGDLISSILENDQKVSSSAKELILQPMTHIPQLRKFLKDSHYEILDEVLVKERNKIYTIIKVRQGANQYKTDFDFIISPVLIERKDKLLCELISKLLIKYKSEIDGLNKATELNSEQLKQNNYIVQKLESLYEIAKDY